MNDRSVGVERVRRKRVVESEVKEPDGQVGIVTELNCNLRKL